MKNLVCYTGLPIPHFIEDLWLRATIVQTDILHSQ